MALEAPMGASNGLISLAIGRTTAMQKKVVTKEALEKLVLARAVGKWGCEDLTGVTVERCAPAVGGRNWTITHLQNEDLPAAIRTVEEIAERLAEDYELEGSQQP
jgi:hypothetical protein